MIKEEIMDKTRKFKIKISFERIMDIEAEDEYKAKDIAENIIKNQTYSNVSDIPFYVGKYEEPRDWYRMAQENAKDIVNSLKEEISKAVDEYVERNGKDIIPSESANDIYDLLYQDEDLWNHANESADGYFIYNSTKANQAKLDCINDLAEYASGDSSLWEGISDANTILARQAYDALSGGIMSCLEDQIKEMVESLLATKYEIS